MMLGSKLARWSIPLAVTALTYLVCAVFWPTLFFPFVDYDVHQQVHENPYIRGLTAENLKHIFTSRCITSYYPVRTLTFAIDYQCWGLPEVGFNGFQLTNGLIHLANSLLVFWLILRLFRRAAAEELARQEPWWDSLAAAFSAGVFAIHPVVVEPVAWVAGREELLMTLGALGCIHLHLAAHRLDQRSEWRWALACRAARLSAVRRPV